MSQDHIISHPSHLHACEDILDVAAVVRRVLAWHRTHGGGRPLVLLASPPCQPHSLAGLGAADGDPRLQVAAAMVQVALLTRASAILFENVEPFCTSQTWLDAADVLREEGFHVDFAVVDAGQLGLPQRRRRVICLAVRGRPTCLMAAAAAAAASQPRATVAEWFPDRRWFYHLHRRSWGQCVYDARRDQIPPLRTNCAYFPVDLGLYRRRPLDAARIQQCRPWTLSALGVCQGFPAAYVWPPPKFRCPCRFCGSSRSAAGKQIGNAIPGAIAHWGIRLLMAVMAPPRWTRAAWALRCAVASRGAARAARRAQRAAQRAESALSSAGGDDVFAPNLDLIAGRPVRRGLPAVAGGPSSVDGVQGAALLPCGGLASASPHAIPLPPLAPAGLAGDNGASAPCSSLIAGRLARGGLPAVSGGPSSVGGVQGAALPPCGGLASESTELHFLATPASAGFAGAIGVLQGYGTQRRLQADPRGVLRPRMLGIPTRQPRENSRAAAERAGRAQEYDGMAGANVRRPVRAPAIGTGNETVFAEPLAGCRGSRGRSALGEPPSSAAHRAARGPAGGRESYSRLFLLCCDVARRPSLAERGACVRCYEGCDCRACQVAVCPYDFSDLWHPALFEDRRSTHVNEMLRSTRKAQAFQLQSLQQRLDNTLVDPRAPVWHPPPDQRPRAGDPRAMFAGYGTASYTLDPSRPTQPVDSARAHPAWARMHRASCAACRVHAAALRAALQPLQADERGLCPGCYGPWMVNQVRAGFDPIFHSPLVRTNIPNHGPVYDEWPSTCKYFSQLEQLRGIMSARQHARPKFHSPLLTIIRLMHRIKAEANGTVPKGRVCLDVKASGLNAALEGWPFRYEDVHAAVRIIPGPGCFVAKLDLVKYFLRLAASQGLQDLLWFSDPRYEAEWRGKGQEPERAWQHRREGRWRRFLTCIFGIKVLPAYANMLSGEICRFFRMFGIRRVTFLTDDFFIVGDSEADCRRQVRLALAVFAALGLESAPAKNEEGRLLDFLGVAVDDRGELRPGWLRLDRLCIQMRRLLAGDTADRDDLRSLAGVMTWQVLFLRGGAAFSRSMWDLVNWPGAGRRVPISAAVRADAQWWFEGVRTRALSGSRMLLHGVALRPLRAKSDGSGSGRWCFWLVRDDGFGALVWGGLPLASNVHVPYVELFAIFACIMIFGASWAGRVVVFGCDSACVCDAFNKGASPDPFLSLLLRYIAAMRSMYRFDAILKHCAREFNQLADCGTRHASMQDFRPFLHDEGFSDEVCAATPQRCRWRSPISSAPISAAPLGRCSRSR